MLWHKQRYSRDPWFEKKNTRSRISPAALAIVDLKTKLEASASSGRAGLRGDTISHATQYTTGSRACGRYPKVLKGVLFLDPRSWASFLGAMTGILPCFRLSWRNSRFLSMFPGC